MKIIQFYVVGASMIEINSYRSDLLGIDLFIVKKETDVHSPISEEHCEVCNFYMVSPSYVKIIRKLQKSKILSQDYPLMCCSCYCVMERKEKL